jgi:3',5'-cyclic AMP phosphodiesterase CpdA
MRTIAHISDLHFGTEVAELTQCIAAELQARPPSLLVISGDLTQRARRSQFAAARDFLKRLPGPQLVVPGNHDVPLYDVVRRFVSPLGRYRRYIHSVLDPIYQDDELFVAGLNTARSLTWQDGRISEAQLRALGRALAGAGSRFKVVVTHHPFIPPPAELQAGTALVGRAEEALSLMDEYDVDLLLAGHYHHGYAGNTRAYYPAARRSIVAAQAGTAVSRRIRGEPNAYNWIVLERGRLIVESRAWNGREFAATRISDYLLRGSAWVPVAPRVDAE